MEQKGNDWKPNLFVAGFAKCGSTALCDYLDQHPDIYVSKPKEPNALSPLYGHDLGNIRQTFEEYRRMFLDHTHLSYRIDGSQVYTLRTDFATHLKDFNPEAKALLMIRDQLRRMVSFYFYQYHGHQIDDFGEWMDAHMRHRLPHHYFYPVVKAYHRQFGDDLRVIDNISLKTDYQQLLSHVFVYLSVAPYAVQRLTSNPSVFTNHDSWLYRRTFTLLFRIGPYITQPAFRLAKRTGVYYQDHAFARLLRNLRPNVILKTVGGKLAARKKHPSDYDALIQHIPVDLCDALEDDYERTLRYIKDHGILLGDTP